MTDTGVDGDSACQENGLERLLVYGSLMRGMANHHRLAGASVRGAAQLQGLALYDLGPFPMAIASGNPADTLHGELVLVRRSQLSALDRFEGVPRLYQRVSWALGDGRRVWVYIGRPRQVRFVNRIADGIWRGPKPASQRHQPPSCGRQNQSQG